MATKMLYGDIMMSHNQSRRTDEVTPLEWKRQEARGATPLSIGKDHLFFSLTYHKDSSHA